MGRTRIFVNLFTVFKLCKLNKTQPWTFDEQASLHMNCDHQVTQNPAFTRVSRLSGLVAGTLPESSEPSLMQKKLAQSTSLRFKKSKLEIQRVLMVLNCEKRGAQEVPGPVTSD